jgi:hypothetical protein
MQRLTISIEDDLAADFEALIASRSGAATWRAARHAGSAPTPLSGCFGRRSDGPPDKMPQELSLGSSSWLRHLRVVQSSGLRPLSFSSFCALAPSASFMKPLAKASNSVSRRV